MERKGKTDAAANADFDRDMAIARQIMDKHWVALRALALGDEFPDLNVAALLAMAEQQREQKGAAVPSRE